MTDARAATGNTAVFIDLENLFGGYAKDVASVPLSELARELKGLLRRGGRTRITSFRAYANWARPAMMAYQKDLMSNGIEAIQIFSHYRNVKNAADIQLVVDALAEAQDRPATDTFVIVTGDGGFVPLARRLRQLDKHVIVASTDLPEAGTVSELLRSAADEYHELAVTRGAPEPPAVARPAQPPAPQTSAPRQPAAPTLEQYRDEIKAVVKRKRELLVDGSVDGSRLGQHLRTKWPRTTFKDFGAATLGGFVEQHCGLAMHRPVAAKRPAAGPQAVAQAPVRAPAKGAAPPSSGEPSKTRYLRAVRAIMKTGPLAAQLQESGRAPLTRLGVALRAELPELTHKDAGYPKLLPAVTDALVGTPWRVEKEGLAAFVVVPGRT